MQGLCLSPNVKLAGLTVAYFIAAAAMVRLTRFDGGVALIWISGAFLTAWLACHEPAKWGPPLVTCGIASMVATTFFGVGPAGALPLAIVNVSESAIAALILHKATADRDSFDSLRWFFAFVLAVGIAAPGVTGIAAALSVSTTTGHTFFPLWLHWFTGHSLGGLTFVPIALQFVRGDVHQWGASTTPRKKAAMTVELGLVALVSAASFSQQTMPLLFLPMLPIILTTFRSGRLASAMAIVILTVVGSVATLRGTGPVTLLAMPIGMKMQFLQFYLACTVLCVLPIAVDLHRRRILFNALRESEARYRLLTEHSTDIVFNLAPDGQIRYVSPSVRQIGGLVAAALVGRNAIDLVEPAYVDEVTAAHRRAVEQPDTTMIVEYQARTGTGELRWFETQTQGVAGDDDATTSVISVVRDVTLRKGVERELAREAMTDPLTGLANRRACLDELARRIEASPLGETGGCVAMFDIDFFKAVNDAHGHAIGDQVLQRFAQIARGAVRDDDTVARLGGEEFAVVLPGASPEQARLVCERLRAAVGNARIDIGDIAILVTVSGGIAAYRQGDTPDAVLAAADAGLYDAKHRGRNRLGLVA